MEKDELFIPAGFDSLTLIRELCTGSMFDSDKPLSYEEYLRPQFTAISQGRGRLAGARRQTVANAGETFLESDDWQTLLS